MLSANDKKVAIQLAYPVEDTIQFFAHDEERMLNVLYEKQKINR